MKAQMKGQIMRLLFLSLCLGLSCFYGSVAMAKTETLDYNVTQKIAHNIEQRAYPKHLVAEVTTTGTRDDAASTGFKLLANYIFGNNTASNGQSADIAMTAPVVQSAQKINMTTPVVQNETTNGTWTMQFAMPKNYSLATLPKPRNQAVKLFAKPSYTVAAIRFTGLATKSNIAKHQNLLRQTLAAKKLVLADETPLYAFYNPPRTLPWLRRNEVWFILKP
jgi:hypothetical protein